MYEVPPARPWAPVPTDRRRELELAEQAAVYLATQRLDRRAVVRCLIDEFEVDRATAEALADLQALPAS